MAQLCAGTVGGICLKKRRNGGRARTRWQIPNSEALGGSFVSSPSWLLECRCGAKRETAL